MNKCDNCASEFDPATTDSLVTKQRERIVAAICEGCCTNTRVAKLVLRRANIGGFNYEQWAPMEAMGGGLTSKQAG